VAMVPPTRLAKFPARRRVSFHDEPLKVDLSSMPYDDVACSEGETQAAPPPNFDFSSGYPDKSKSPDEEKYLAEDKLGEAAKSSDDGDDEKIHPQQSAFNEYLMDKNKRLEEENALLRMQMASQMAGLQVATQGLRFAQGMPMSMPSPQGMPMSMPSPQGMPISMPPPVGLDGAWQQNHRVLNGQQCAWPQNRTSQPAHPQSLQQLQQEKNQRLQQEKHMNFTVDAGSDTETDPGQGFDSPEVKTVQSVMPKADADNRRTVPRDPDATQAVQQTSIMLRNLPNCYTREMLMKLLEDEGFAGKYDFLYLPMDFKTKLSLAYAFINFVSTEEAKRFWKHFHGFSNWVIPSRKNARVSWSEIQGLASHIEHLSGNSIMHKHVPDQYKPVLLSGNERVPFPAPTEKVRAQAGPRDAANLPKKSSRPKKELAEAVPPGRMA